MDYSVGYAIGTFIGFLILYWKFIAGGIIGYFIVTKLMKSHVEQQDVARNERSGG